MTYNDRIRGIEPSVAIKAPARVATTENITLSGLLTVDGVALAADDRVLVKDQTDTSENGIWTVKSTAWVRAIDFNGSRDIVQGTQVYVVNGDINNAQTYRVATVNPVVGSALEFATAYSTLDDVDSVARNYPTIADLVSSALLTVGDRVRTYGYSTAGDGGGGAYEIVAAATGTDDGGSYHDLSSISGQAKLLHNGTIAAEQFGAVSGVEASAQIQAAWDALVTWRNANTGVGGSWLTHKSSVTIQNQVSFTDAGAICPDGMNFDIRGSVWTGVSGGDLSDTNPMLYVRCPRSVQHHGKLDGGFAFGGLDLRNNSGARIFYPEVKRYKGKGIRVRGSAGSMVLTSPHISEYVQGDDGFGVQSNYTGIGLSVETGDFNVYNANILFNGKGVYLDEDAVQVHLVEPHIVMGNSEWDAGGEPIALVMMGQSNTGTNSGATSGSKVVEDGVYIWNGDYQTHGTAFVEAEFGTFPLNVGSDPWANNPGIAAANQLAADTGREVYVIWIADGGRPVEVFLKPDTLTDNGWSAGLNVTDYMYPDIKDAIDAIPGRNSSFPDLFMWLHGGANSSDTAAEYQEKLEALVADMTAERVFHPEKTVMTAGGLDENHAYYSTHATAVTAAESNIPTLTYIPSTGLADIGDDAHFTGEALITLGELCADETSLANDAEGGGPFCDGILVENHATRENHFDAPYFDNGVVDDHAGTLNISGGHYVYNGAATIFEPKIRIYPTEVDQALPAELRINNIGGLATVNFVDTDDYNWTGEWLPLAAQYDNMAEEDRQVSYRQTQFNIWPNNAANMEYNYKPEGNFLRNYVSGENTLGMQYLPDPGEVRVNGSSADAPANANTVILRKTGDDRYRIWHASRAALVTWADDFTPDVGTVVCADDIWYQYDGSETAITDMAGWRPFGDIYPDHFATNTTPGTTDMATAIVAAAHINGSTGSSSSPGHTVHFKAEKYAHGAIVIGRDAVRLRGAGKQATQLLCLSATGNGITFGDGATKVFRPGIEDMTVGMASGVEKTAGAHIKILRGRGGTVRNLDVEDWFDGLTLEGTDRLMVYDVTGSNLNRSLKAGKFISQIYHTAETEKCTDNKFTFVRAAASSVTGDTGMYIESNDGCHIIGCNFNQFDYALQINADASNPAIGGLMCTNCYFDESTINNLLITGDDEFRNAKFTGCYFRAAGEDSIHVTADVTVDGCLFTGCSCETAEEMAVNWIAQTTFSVNFIGHLFDDNLRDDTTTTEVYFNGDNLTMSGCCFRGGWASGVCVTLGANSTNCEIGPLNYLASVNSTTITDNGSGNNVIQLAGFVGDADDTSLASVAADIDELRDAIIAAGLMAAS